MRSNTGKATLITCAIALFSLAPLLSGCSGCGDGSTTDGTDTTGTGAGGMNGGRMDGTDANGSGANAGNASDGASNTDTRTSDMNGADANKTPLTATEERTKTREEMSGLRAILMVELAAVRDRLGRTAEASAKEADKIRAAELAQGLERIDRAIIAIDEATDVSWGTIRESQLKEAGEVRAWMAKYGMNVSA